MVSSSDRDFVALSARIVCTFTLVLISSNTATTQTFPRGVSKILSSSYKPGPTFTCLDGSLTIPFDQINDDYCDCQDGSDEPGTAACPNGKFYCMNKGFKPEVIPASRVSDGICDCCDGSDEYEKKVECQNTCLEMGKAMREEMLQLRALVEEGHRIRSDYSVQGKEAKKEQQALLVTLGPEREKLQKVKDELQIKKEEAEGPEKEAKDAHDAAWKEEVAKKEAENDNRKARDAFSELDIDADGLLVVAEILLRKDFDKDENGIITEEEAKEFLAGYDSLDVETFITDAWPLVRDKYKAPTPEPAEPLQSPPVDEKANADITPDIDDDDDDDDSDFDEEDFEDNDEKDAEREEKEENNMMPDYPEETKALIEAADLAREEFSKVEKEFLEVEKQIQDIEKFLSMDLGPDDVFYPLKGDCFEYTDREYTYKVCPFDRVTQRPKGGGQETSLGNFQSWTESGEEKYNYMKFEKGLHCWNGPDRSATVKLICGKENVLSAAAEPNRCEYTFDFTTPAACHELPELETMDDHHDEL